MTLTWWDGGLRPVRPPELEEGRELNTNGALFVGEKGKILSDRRSYRLIPETRAKEYGDPPKRLERSVGHYKEWLNAAKGGPAAGSNFDWAGPLTEAVLLGNVALRTQMREEMTKRVLTWDPIGLRFTNSEAATQFLRRNYREGWTLA